jgi:hypothetical protein
VFYRIWHAAKRRPTRALIIVAGVILVVSAAHACAIYLAFMAWADVPELTTPAQLSSRLAAAMSYAKWGLAMDWVAWVVAMLLLAWAGWRMCRRLP